MSDKYIRNISLKLRLYPTKEQEIYFNKCFGCSRFVYNYCLNERNEFYKNNIKGIEDKEKRKEIYKKFKETSFKELKIKFPWLCEIEAQIICNAQQNIRKAFNNFFSGKSNLPKFHSKKNRNSSDKSSNRWRNYMWS